MLPTTTTAAHAASTWASAFGRRAAQGADFLRGAPRRRIWIPRRGRRRHLARRSEAFDPKHRVWRRSAYREAAHQKSQGETRNEERTQPSPSVSFEAAGTRIAKLPAVPETPTLSFDAMPAFGAIARPIHAQFRSSARAATGVTDLLSAIPAGRKAECRRADNIRPRWGYLRARWPRRPSRCHLRVEREP